MKHLQLKLCTIAEETFSGLSASAIDIDALPKILQIHMLMLRAQFYA